MMTLRIPCAGGGYDYDFVDDIQSKYQCVICQCVLLVSPSVVGKTSVIRVSNNRSH